MPKQWKKIEAGSLVVESLYSVSDRRQPNEQRAARSQASTAMQRLANLKHSRLRLELLLAANFTWEDLFLTLTFRDDSLPHTREGARQALKAFFRELRAARKLRGAPVRYVYAIENRHGEGRWHIHVVMNRTGQMDLEDICSLWLRGNADVERLRDMRMFRRRYREKEQFLWEMVAGYLCKERQGPGDVGRQGWTHSRGLTRPRVMTRRCSDHETLRVPPDAEILDQITGGGIQGEYAFYKYMTSQPGQR